MIKLYSWIRRKLFGPTVQEALIELVRTINKAHYEKVHIPSVKLGLESLEKVMKTHCSVCGCSLDNGRSGWYCPECD